jgi:hypothetical protein
MPEKIDIHVPFFFLSKEHSHIFYRKYIFLNKCMYRKLRGITWNTQQHIRVDHVLTDLQEHWRDGHLVDN